MVKGGYKIINLKDTNLVTGSDAVTIKGIYESIEDNYRKPLLLSGIVIDGVEKADMYVSFYVNEGKLSATLYNKVITIADDDTVTLTAIA